MKTIEIVKGAKTVLVDDDPFNVPNTDLTIWKVKVENANHERELYSTMSKQVATVGFSGDIEVYENDRGKVYIRKAPKEEDHGSNYSNNSGGSSYVQRPDHHEEIKAQWAIGQAVQLLIPTINGPTEAKAETEVEKWATKFYAMVDRVKNSQVDKEPSSAKGYESFKQSKPTAQNPDPEFASMMARGFEADDIKLEDIPF